MKDRIYRKIPAQILLVCALILSMALPLAAQAPPVPAQPAPPVPAVPAAPRASLMDTQGELPPDLFVSSKGFVLLYVERASPAARAGLRVGDVILAVNGEPVDHLFRVWRIVRQAKPGDVLMLTVRSGDTLDNRIIIAGSRDEGRGHDYTPRRHRSAWFGVLPFPVAGQQPNPNPSATTLEDDMLCTRSRTWAISVTTVTEGSPAAEAGIAPGDVIISIGGKQIDRNTSPTELVESFAPGETVDIHVFFLTKYNEAMQQAMEAAGIAAGEGAPSAEAPSITGAGSEDEDVPVAEIPADEPDEGATEAVEATEDPASNADTLTKDDIDTVITVTLGANPVNPSRAWLGVLGVPMVHSESVSCSSNPRTMPMIPGMPDGRGPRGEMPGRGTLSECINGESALMVVEVLAGSPAQVAGIAPGDAILGINMDALPRDIEAATLFADFAPGDTAILRVLHLGVPGGSFEEPVTVTFDEHPEDAARAFLGVGGYATLIADGAECVADSMLLPAPMPPTVTPDAQAGERGTPEATLEPMPAATAAPEEESEEEPDATATPLPVESLEPTIVPQQTPTPTPA